MTGDIDIPREPKEILKLADIEPEYAEVSKVSNVF